jgi:ribose 5-phosphate isomerase B
MRISKREGEDKMKLAIGSDHGGFHLKEAVVARLKAQGHEVMDLGCADEQSVDYPDYGLAVAEAVAAGEAERGIAICGTGLGICISVNKVPGIRGTLCTDSTMARLSRQHNNSNMLVLGGRIVGETLALDIVDTWLTTPFEGGRHQKRLDKITAIEEKYAH